MLEVTHDISNMRLYQPIPASSNTYYELDLRLDNLALGTHHEHSINHFYTHPQENRAIGDMV